MAETNGKPPALDDSRTLQGIRYSRGSLELLDQRKLPLESTYIKILDADAGWHAIRDMVVRGAPAIAIAAALSLAVELHLHPPFENTADVTLYVQKRLQYLVSSRPTAVNLRDAADKLTQLCVFASSSNSKSGSVVESYQDAAEQMLKDDVAANKAIGDFGAEALLGAAAGRRPDGNAPERLRVLTHCNTGSLATAAYGTALGVMRSLYAAGRLEHAYCTETRPYNQGSRLTAYELVHDGIPATLIADSAAAALMAAGRVDAIVVGADRIAANGDTANKIGTYSLAIAARHHGVPFFIAAPLTSTDRSMPDGGDIVIEERSEKELTHALGGAGPRIAPYGIAVWNPAFDVTPAGLIAGIITDKGVIYKNNSAEAFDIPAYVEAIGPAAARDSPANDAAPETATRTAPAKNPVQQHKDGLVEEAVSSAATALEGAWGGGGTRRFRALNEGNVAEYLASVAGLAERLGGGAAEWDVHEVGDGNLNYVYIVKGPKGSLVLKQALPYVRCVGESWPMTLERAFFEAETLREHAKWAPEHVPPIYHFDHPMALMAMRYLEPPHIILRKGLIEGQEYPLLAEHMASYMARTLFHTSLLALPTDTYRAQVAKYCGNSEMCRLTEQVIFTEPYMVAPNNRWTSPHLDADAAAVREDDDLKVEIAELKAKFCSNAQALLHGDLHTGSIMVTPGSTQVIDPEFGFYGPIGFDLGAFFGNLFLAFFSQDGHATDKEPREGYKAWLLEVVGRTWDLFEEEFLRLWTDRLVPSTRPGPGDAYPAALYSRPALLRAAQEVYMRQLAHDTLGFAGAKMIRRIVGIAHVEDFESIPDPARRAACERAALDFAKRLVKERAAVGTVKGAARLLTAA